MVTPKNSIALGIIILVVVLFFWLSRDSDVQKIKKNLQTLTQLCSKQQQESTLDSLQKAGTIVKLLTDPCQLYLEKYDHQGEYSRKEIRDRILLVRNRSDNIKVRLHDTSIKVKAEEAEVTATLDVQGVADQEEAATIQEVVFSMKKTDGDWLLSRVTFVEVLEE